MVINLCEFVSALNHSLLSGQHSFRVSNTSKNLHFARYLRKSGYLIAFVPSQAFIRIWPRQSLPNFRRITSASTPSRSVYYGRHRITSELRAGRTYFLFSNGYFYDSYYAVQSNMGGFVVARVS